MLLLALAAASSGCAGIATGVLADALSASGGGYGRDDDPELVAAAAPFGLKTMESVLEREPEHRGLLLALASGFAQYAYAFVDLPADEIEDQDLDRALAQRARARRLYLRARRYAIRGLEVEHPGLEAALRVEPKAALVSVEREDLPLLYWAAASWGLAIGASKNEPAVFADLPLVVALAERALELDEAFNGGALHELSVTLESSRPGGDPEKAKRHFERAKELSGGRRIGTYLGYAESVLVKKQDSREFHRLLDLALAIDLEAHPEDRLVNEIMLRKARRLKASSGDLFLDDVGAAE